MSLLLEAWKISSGSLSYRVQVDDINVKMKDKLLKEMEGWNIAAEIIPPTEKNDFGLILSKTFESQEDFSKWYKSISYPIKIYSSTTDEVIKKRLKEGKKEKKEKKKRKVSRCSICNKKGHNSRKCKEKENDKK